LAFCGSETEKNNKIAVNSVVFNMTRHPLFLWLILLGCLALPTVFSQNNPPLDTVAARAEGFFLQKKYDDALALLEPGAIAAQKATDWKMYYKFVSSTAQAYRAKKEFQKSLLCVQLGIEVLAQADTTRAEGTALQVWIGQLWVSRAVSHRLLEQYSEALTAYQTAIGVFQKSRYRGPQLPWAYKNAAQIYQRFSNHQQAANYLSAALHSDTAHTLTAEIYHILANNCIFTDSTDRAKHYYRLGIAERKMPADIQAALNGLGAELGLRESNLAEAKHQALAALTYYRSDPKETDNRLRSLTTLADIAARQHQPRQALGYYRQAEAEGKKSYTFKSREMAKLYIEWGRFWEKQRQPDSALHCYQRALVQAFPKFNSLNVKDNPSLSEAWLESQAMEAALAKGMLLASPPAPLQKGEGRRDSTSRRMPLLPSPFWIGVGGEAFDLAFAVSAHMRRTYGNDADKLTLAANLRPALNAAALNLRSLHAADPSPAHLIHLFDLLEQNRATALADALRQQRALALADIPDTLLAREDKMRRELAGLEKDVKKKELDRDSAGMTNLQPAYLRAFMDYGQVLDRLQRQYPRFSQYTQAQQAAGIKEIALALPDTAALLQWHDAGDRYLCVVLQPDKELALHEVLRDTALDHALAHFVALLSDKTAQEHDPAAYFRAAYFLGEKFLPPAVLSAAKSLIVIPDGLLCRLPFEALLTRPHSGGYADAPYLLRSHTVRYAWSGTLLVQYEPKATGKGLLQLAPFATAARDGLPPLPNSLRDKPDGLSADVLQGADATTGLFLQKAPAYAALHLSTHASAGGWAVPGIEFADRTLALPEIYAQRLHASLVSLSACETAAGSFAQSEGVLSLARAFAYAGAQSLVASHWSVNERSTADLFSAFYENLKGGLPKAEALRRAKLRYLASAELDARKLPFHWAAFTLTGVDGQVQLERGGQWWMWAAAMLLCVLALAGFRRFSRR